MTAFRRRVLLGVAFGLRAFCWAYLGLVVISVVGDVLAGIRTGYVGSLLDSPLTWLMGYAVFILWGWSRDLREAVRKGRTSG